MSSLLDDPSHWRDCAKEARAVARDMTDAKTKEIMLNIAASYDALAKQAEERLAARPAQQSHSAQPAASLPSASASGRSDAPTRFARRSGVVYQGRSHYGHRRTTWKAAAIVVGLSDAHQRRVSVRE